MDEYRLLIKKRYDENISEIVSGGQKSINKDTLAHYGADWIGESWARFWDLPIKTFPADWKTHGRAAGPIRNSQMADYADTLIAFWDGKSRGTKSMIDLAEEHKLTVHVIRY